MEIYLKSGSVGRLHWLKLTSTIEAPSDTADVYTLIANAMHCCIRYVWGYMYSNLPKRDGRVGRYSTLMPHTRVSIAGSPLALSLPSPIWFSRVGHQRSINLKCSYNHYVGDSMSHNTRRGEEGSVATRKAQTVVPVPSAWSLGAWCMPAFYPSGHETPHPAPTGSPDTACPDMLACRMQDIEFTLSASGTLKITILAYRYGPVVASGFPAGLHSRNPNPSSLPSTKLYQVLHKKYLSKKLRRSTKPWRSIVYFFIFVFCSVFFYYRWERWGVRKMKRTKKGAYGKYLKIWFYRKRI